MRGRRGTGRRRWGEETEKWGPLEGKRKGGRRRGSDGYNGRLREGRIESCEGPRAILKAG